MHDDEPRWASTRHVWRRTGYVMAWAVNVGIAGGLGITGLTNPDSRFAAPTYDGLRDSLGIGGWSTVLTLYAAALIAAAWLPARATIAIFRSGCLVYLAIGFYFAAGLGDPHASPWGPIAFVGFGVWQATQGEAYRQAIRRQP